MAPERAATFVRVLVLVLLATAPLLAGAVHEPVFIPLLAGSALAGLVTLLRHTARARPAAAGPRGSCSGSTRSCCSSSSRCRPRCSRAVSPGSFAFYGNQLLVPPLVAWKPISVSPPDTLRGLAFLAAFSLLAIAVFRELGEGRWRRRLLRTVVFTGLALTVVALLQAVSSEPRRLYGVWQPRWDWAVFGPYVNRNHFAGYLVMAAALARRLRARGARAAARGLGHPPARLPAARRGRGPGARARGGGRDGDRGRPRRVAVAGRRLGLRLRDAGRPAADRLRQRAALSAAGRRWTALAVLLLVAWASSGSASAACSRRSRCAASAAAGSTCGATCCRWSRHFPVFGVGWNAFATAYPWYQTDLEDRVDRRGAQRLPAGAPRRRRPGPRARGGLLAIVLRSALAPGPSLAGRSRPAGRARWAWRSTSSSTSTARSPPTPRPESPSPPQHSLPPPVSGVTGGLDGGRGRP